MNRLLSLAIAAAAVTAVASPAHADTTQLGFWFGPHIYSDKSVLGYIDAAPFHPVLQDSFEFGLRVARPFFPWLVPELELAMSPTATNALGGAPAADVFWLEPRLHLRIELAPQKRFAPFLVIGGGSPIALSSARQTFDTGIVGEGYIGAGIRINTAKGFNVRFDARLSFIPSLDNKVAPEADFGIGLSLDLSKRGPAKHVQEVQVTALDHDGDGVPDSEDQCPDRLEDQDGFEDKDGCPDIDNDLDGVLDIADKCPNVPETYNGFEDDDGCPDTVPPDVDSLRGTVEGLIYADGETVVRDSATPGIQKIAKIMKAHPSIRVVLIGHTDAEEAKQFATKPENGEAAPDIAALNADLSRARAEAVKQALGTQGIPGGRIDVEGHGAEEPVSDNDKPRGRLANRRVEIKLFVPIRARK